MSDLLSIKEIIERDGAYVSTPHGDSMWPMLHNKKDTACIVKKTGRLKKHDVALYIRSNGQYVLHRVMQVTEDGYVMCGDSQLVLEHGIKEEQVIGVLEAFYRGSKYHTVKEKRYRLYVFIWCLSSHLRKFLMKCVGYIENKHEKMQSKKKGTTK